MTNARTPDRQHPKLLKLADVADQFGVSTRTVERIVARGELGIVRIGGSTRTTQEFVDAYIAAHSSEAAS